MQTMHYPGAFRALARPDHHIPARIHEVLEQATTDLAAITAVAAAIIDTLDRDEERPDTNRLANLAYSIRGLSTYAADRVHWWLEDLDKRGRELSDDRLPAALAAPKPASYDLSAKTPDELRSLLGTLREQTDRVARDLQAALEA